MPKRLLTPCLLTIAVAGLAACGSSNKVGGIQLAPSAGPTTPTITATVTSTSTSSTPTVTTPTSGPLAHKPTVAKLTGKPPKTLVIKDLVKGTGKPATTASTVTVNYVGVLYTNGKEFDSSWKRGMPTSFPLSGVIKGWTQGIPGMKIGGRRELIIPPGLAYGSASQPGIPANSTLVFVIDLLGVS